MKKDGVKRVVKRKNVWKIVGIIKFIDSLVFDGTLKDVGYDEIYRMVREEFKEYLSDPVYSLDKRKFRRKVNERIWTELVLKQIRKAIRQHLKVEDTYKDFLFIPYGQFLYKWNWLKGKNPKASHTSYIRGIGRLTRKIARFSAKPYVFLKNSFEEPIKIKGDSILFLNGVNLGIPHSAVISENPARQALENAENREDKAVILTNFLDLEFKRASGSSGLRVFRALVSGRNINPEVFDEDYSKEVRDILAREEYSDGLIYQTTAELFIDSLRGWLKIVGTKNKPTYSGDVFVILGYKEEAMIAAAAYSEVHYFWQKELNRLQFSKRTMAYKLSKAHKNKLSNVKKLEERLQKINENIARKRVLSNVSDRDFRMYFNRVLAFVISMVEQTIPNSKVVGIGSQYLKIGDDIIKVVIPKHIRPTDTLLADYCNKYSSEVLSGEMPNAVVICHPYALNYKFTMRENDSDGQRGNSSIFVAPIVVDEKRIKNTIRDIIRPVGGISKTTLSQQFKAGMLRLISTSGTIQPEPWSIPSIANYSNYIKSRKYKHGRIPSSYIWIMIGTDPHWGSSTKQFVILDDGRRLDVVSSVIELMRKDNLFNNGKFPLHMFVLNDDPTQGNHFGTQQRPHVNKMPYINIENEFRRLYSMAANAGNKEKMEFIREITDISLKQILLRGEHWTGDQMGLVLDQFIEPNIDFFEALLLRAVSAKIIIKGISEIEGNMFDTRDPGLVNLGTGNHFLKSANGELTEGFIYARVLRSLLSAKHSLKNLDLAKAVRAPLYSNQFITYGTIRTPNGYEYAIDWRDTPSKMAGWGDPLLGWVRVDLRRGNYARHLDKKLTIKICGDKHFGAHTYTPWSIYIMGMPGTATDQYAEMGGAFPSNNTGVSFIGVPTRGPENGPILGRSISYAELVGLFRDNRTIDWKSFFPNPA